MKNEKNRGREALLLFLAMNFVFLAVLTASCSDKSDDTKTPAPPPAVKGNLSFETADMNVLGDKEEGSHYYGSLYAGIYEAPDETPIDVWVSVRETDTARDIGTVERVGVIIQGGTGSEVTNILNRDEGVHTFLIAINYRGSSLTDITAEQKCLPGSGFIPCLKEHNTFSKTNPKLNAQDANAIIQFFTDDKSEFTVNGVSMKEKSPRWAGGDGIRVRTEFFDPVSSSPETEIPPPAGWSGTLFDMSPSGDTLPSGAMKPRGISEFEEQINHVIVPPA